MYGTNGIVGFTQIKNGVKTNYYYRKNLQGDIVAVYGENGTKYAQYAYNAWGNCTVLSDTNGIGVLNPIRYRGYYYDSEIKLYYLNARYYDPEVGRFISQDSIKYIAPETLNGINLFAYCLNNPVMETDPEGTWSWKAFGMVVAAVAIVAVFALATAVTAGVAGAAIAGIAGFSTLGVQAVGTVVGVTALASGIVVGSNEIAKQITEKGAEDINLLSVTISTVGGGIDGAFVAGSLFTVDPMKTSFLYAGRIVAPGIRGYLYGLSEGYSVKDSLYNSITSMGVTAVVGSLMFSTTPVNLLSLLFKPLTTGGIKLLAEIGKNIWSYFISPLIDFIIDFIKGE